MPGPRRHQFHFLDFIVISCLIPRASALPDTIYLLLSLPALDFPSIPHVTKACRWQRAIQPSIISQYGLLAFHYESASLSDVPYPVAIKFCLKYISNLSYIRSFGQDLI